MRKKIVITAPKRSRRARRLPSFQSGYQLNYVGVGSSANVGTGAKAGRPMASNRADPSIAVSSLPGGRYHATHYTDARNSP
jgi:hypothetical protein